jgi:hypothetical protein
MIPFVLLAALLAGDGTEDELPRRLATDLVEARNGSWNVGLSFGADALAAIPFGVSNGGSAVAGGNSFQILSNMDYSKLFELGWGFALEANLMTRAPAREGKPPWTQPPELGGYVALEVEWFAGREFKDDSGTRIQPQTMRLPQIFAGVKSTGTVRDNFFGDFQLGAGLAHFPSLEATFRTVGGPGFKGELFADTWSFAMELRVHAGWRWGPGSITVGMGGGFIAPPDRGTSANLDFAFLWTLDFDIGMEITF